MESEGDLVGTYKVSYIVGNTFVLDPAKVFVL